VQCTSNVPDADEQYLYDCIDEFLVVYMDDLLIFSKNEEDHMRYVEKVLMRLRQNELYVSPKKCVFMGTEMEFLGFIVGNDGLRVDPKKIEVSFSEDSYPDSRKLQYR
jgi:Reverse transcriptase (RNA-dependent DNA polymerase)